MVPSSGSMLALFATLSLLGLSVSAQPARPGSAPRPAPAAPALPHAAVELTEAQALGVLEAIDREALEQARLVRSRDSDPRALTFAALLEAEHTASVARTAALRRTLGLEPTDSVVRHTLTDVGASVRRRLSALSGLLMARAFADAQVRQLAQALDAVDQALLPNTGPGPLHQTLAAEVRPRLAAEHRRARELARVLAGS